MFRRRRAQEPAEERTPAELPPEPGPPAGGAVVRRQRRDASGLAGLGLRSRPSGLAARLRSIFGGGQVAEDAWEAAEEALIAADVGASATLELVEAARARFRAGGGRGGEDARHALADEVRARLERVGSGQFELGTPPSVILFVGVNGTGKTTTIAKLGARLRADGHSVILAAADTFRAAAIEQLRLWGEEVGVPVVAQRAGADPGAVAYDAVTAAESRGLDAVLVDTAGRLQSKTQLMAELGKIRRVIERRLPDQPRHVLLVLDATTGQNGVAQAEAFSAEAGVTGIVLTKLDGTAKGGVAVSVADRLRIPIQFVGVGENVQDLAPFDPEAYVTWLLGE